ncbi:KTSC domain-containing protein [Lysobacter sp. MMG2]|uniref:KTSC domain-containing protein n=1 Tax=Lysobacter sp. MMG2 TaxID=2801338 RepID=UPI001C2149CC|nr:KTSC domain-containing protein [Lysobacter sp. MMG2]MBU8974652.1 KTSC domain-containing protein [Lysobacter sp. MMG2]
MEREHVESQAIVSVGYDPDRRLLEVEFEGGAVYRYFDVPPELHAGMMTAPSQGRFFAQYLRDAGFDYIRMDSDEGAD